MSFNRDKAREMLAKHLRQAHPDNALRDDRIEFLLYRLAECYTPEVIDGQTGQEWQSDAIVEHQHRVKAEAKLATIAAKVEPLTHETVASILAAEVREILDAS